MQEFLTIIKNKIVAAPVIAILVIIIVGIFKLLPGWEKVNKTGRKAIYETLALIFSVGISLAYELLFLKEGWSELTLQFVITAVAELHVAYPIYENYGIRDLIRKIGTLLHLSKTNKEERSNTVSETGSSVESDVEDTDKKETKKEEDSQSQEGWLE